MPIRSITCRSRADTFTYPATGSAGGAGFQQLYDRLKGVQAGRLPDTYGWCDRVAAAGDYVADVAAVVGEGVEESGEKDKVDVNEDAGMRAAIKQTKFFQSSYVLGLMSLAILAVPWVRETVVGWWAVGSV